MPEDADTASTGPGAECTRARAYVEGASGARALALSHPELSIVGMTDADLPG